MTRLAYRKSTGPDWSVVHLRSEEDFRKSLCGIELGLYDATPLMIGESACADCTKVETK